MRLIFDNIDGERSLALTEGDPLPPDDRAVGCIDRPKLSLDEIYRSQAPRLMRFFARRTDRQDAADLVQESFVRLAGADASADQAPEKPEAYLNQIATNLLRNRARVALQRSMVGHVCADDVPLAANDMIAAIEARDVLTSKPPYLAFHAS